MTEITTTVTFEDLIAQCDDELDDLRDAYDDVDAMIREEFGDSATMLRDTDDADADVLAGLIQTRELINATAKKAERRRNALETLADEFDGGAFELKMLTGSEVMGVETELRMEAERRDVEVTELSSKRKQLVADAATVDAPAGFPTDDESPTPSDAPNPIYMALYEAAENLTTAGSADFRARGFGDREGIDLSATPAGSLTSSSGPAPDADATPESGDSS